MGLYRVESNLTGVLLGTVPGSGYVDMMGDSDEVLCITNGTAYRYFNGTVAEIADADFPGAQWGEYLDGYAIIGPGDGKVYVNQTPGDFSAWNALDFATAEGAPDDIIGGIVDHRQAFFGGRETIEIWENTGNADFPLERSPGGFIELGLGSTFGFAKHSNSVFFYASDGTIRTLSGYDPIRISTHAVEQAIEAYADKRCTTLTWTESGHAMVGFTWAEGTWVYDLSTQLWHERQSYGRTRWRPVFSLRAYDKWIVGDYLSNKLGYLDPSTFSEWGDVLRWSATCPSINQENQFVRHQRLELIFETGVGLLTGQGSDPQVMLRFSDDGGRTWSNEHWRSLGTQGAYRDRVAWNRLGMARDRVYEVSISDPVRRTLVEAHLYG
jgi:glutamine cyclotransferase